MKFEEMVKVKELMNKASDKIGDKSIYVDFDSYVSFVEECTIDELMNEMIMNAREYSDSTDKLMWATSANRIIKAEVKARMN